MRSLKFIIHSEIRSEVYTKGIEEIGVLYHSRSDVLIAAINEISVIRKQIEVSTRDITCQYLKRVKGG
jgi:hypothetical protein